MTEHHNPKPEPPLAVSPDIKPRAPLAADIETPTVALVGFVGTIVLIAIIVALQVVYYRVAAAQVREKDLDQPIVELQKATNAQQTRLAQYRWVDQTKGVVAIPIERAMEIVVQETPPGSAWRSPAVPPSAGGTSNAKP